MPIDNPFSESMTVKVGGDTSGAIGALSKLTGSIGASKAAMLGLAGVAAGALVAGLAKAVRAAADFEEAMVEVEKVTDPQTADEMAGAIKDMARTIPLGQEALAGLAADAARFGVRGPENLRKFSESAAKMAIATDLSAEKAGEAFARLAELTDTPIDKIENLGSAINSLSNNFATSSSEIVDSMLRSSAALSQLGLQQTEIAGLSAALNEVSESSRRAGSRLRRLAQEMMDPTKVSDLAAALGMTVDEFKRMRDEDPVGLIRLMAESFAEGGQAADGLRSALSTTSRQAVAGLAQNLDGMNEALDTSKTQFRENTSLQREFAAATNTFNARVQILKNRLNNVAIRIGEALLPAMTDLVNVLIKVVDAVDRSIDKLDKFNRRAEEFAQSNQAMRDESDKTEVRVRTLGDAFAWVAGREREMTRDLHGYGQKLDETDNIVEDKTNSMTVNFQKWFNTVAPLIRRYQDETGLAGEKTATFGGTVSRVLEQVVGKYEWATPILETLLQRYETKAGDAETQTDDYRDSADELRHSWEKYKDPQQTATEKVNDFADAAESAQTPISNFDSTVWDLKGTVETLNSKLKISISRIKKVKKFAGTARGEFAAVDPTEPGPGPTVGPGDDERNVPGNRGDGGDRPESGQPMQHGGIVSSGAMAATLHGPEAVIPLNRRGARFLQRALGGLGGDGGRTIHIRELNVQADDAQALVDDIIAHTG